MWDTVENTGSGLSHDLPCFGCGHPAHHFLACSETCGCEGLALPGAA